MKDLRKAEDLVKEAAGSINAEPEQLTAAIKKFQKELEILEKELSSLKKKLR